MPSQSQREAKRRKKTGVFLASSATKEKRTMSQIILPENYKNLSRKELIDQFLNEWLTKKQVKGMRPWFVEMLNAFATELAIHSGSQNFGSLLGERFLSKGTKYPLAIIPEATKKPFLAKVGIEEIGGGLTSGVKVVPTREIEDEVCEHT